MYGKKCNLANKESTKICNCLADILPGGTVDLCLQTGIALDASDGFYAVTGYGHDEIKEESLYQKLIYPHDMHNMEELVIGQINQNGRAELQCRMMGGNGKGLLWVQLYAGIMQNDEGEKYLKIAVFDITKAREKELDFAVSEERYRIISEQMKDCIFDWNMQSGAIYHSPAFGNNFGYTLPTENTADYLAKSDIIFSEDKPRLAGIFRDLRRGLPYSETEYRIKKGDEYIWCKVRATTISRRLFPVEPEVLPIWRRCRIFCRINFRRER